MLKLFIFSLCSFTVFAQVETEDNVVQFEESQEYQYLPLKDNKVYDVEIIVFAYRNALPNNKTYQNEPIFDDSAALQLIKIPEDIPLVKTSIALETNETETPQTEVTTTDKQEYTVAIEDEENNTEALVWFEHNEEDLKLTPIWKRLIKQPNIVPLFHKGWRQPETPFENPTYVKISNVLVYSDPQKPTDSLIEPSITNQPQLIQNTAITGETNINSDGNIETNLDVEDISINQNPYYADFTLTGMVALSQGRFMHFGHKLNLFRTQQNEDYQIENMVFSLIERKQLKTDELNYFDSPWFGSIVKITEFTGENNEEDDNE